METEAPSVAPAERQLISLDTRPPPPAVLELVKLAQAQNGLRHNDYDRYHKYCARRLHTIRHAKDVNFTYGKGKKFVKRELTAELVTDPRHLQIPLMEAERAWADSMLIQQRSEAGGPSTSDERVHRLHRLKKAVAHASSLYALASETADPRTVMEAEAYALWMRGTYAVEKQDWETGTEALSRSRSIYDTLAGVAVRRQKELFAKRSQELASSEKLCRYHLARKQGKSLASASAGAAAAVASSGGGAGVGGLQTSGGGGGLFGSAEGNISSITWRGTHLPLRNDKMKRALSDAVGKAGQLASLEGMGDAAETLYLDVLTRLDDAIRLAEGDAARSAKDGREGSAADSRGLVECFSFLKSRHTLDHTHGMIEEVAAKLLQKREDTDTPQEAEGTMGGDPNTHPWHLALHSGSASSSSSSPAGAGAGAGGKTGGSSSTTPGSLQAANQAVILHSRCLTTLDEMLGLAGGEAEGEEAPRGPGSSFPPDTNLIAALNARRGYYLAWRARYAAAAQLHSRHYSEATLLFHRAGVRAQEALLSYSTLPDELIDALPPTRIPAGSDDIPPHIHTAAVLSGVSRQDAASLEGLVDEVKSQTLTLQATALLDQISTKVRADAGLAEAYVGAFTGPGCHDPAIHGKLAPPTTLKRSTTRPAYLIDRLQPTSGMEPTADPRAIAPWPTGPLAVPFKPFLFDLAFNYFDEAPAPATPAKTSGTPASTPTTAGAGGAGGAGGGAAPSPSSSGLLSWLTGR